MSTHLQIELMHVCLQGNVKCLHMLIFSTYNINRLYCMFYDTTSFQTFSCNLVYAIFTFFRDMHVIKLRRNFRTNMTSINNFKKKGEGGQLLHDTNYHYVSVRMKLCNFIFLSSSNCATSKLRFITFEYHMIELRLKEANTLKKKKSLAYEINKVVE